MNVKMKLLLVAGLGAAIALPVALAQSSRPVDSKEVSAAASADSKVQSEAERKAKRRADAAKEKAEAERSGKLDKNAKEDEEEPIR
jgi:antitoxin component of MazEF toxin-antitoxin module